MSGSLPKTRLLLTEFEIVVGEFNHLGDIAFALGVKVDDDGFVTFMGRKSTMNYGESWGNDKNAIVKDWAKCYMKLPDYYKVYRYLVNG